MGIDEIRTLYDVCFTEDGLVKPCGRQACIRLIKAMSNRFPNESFGDENTGYMRVDTIQSFYQTL
jgi:hypothetical protein